MANPQTNIISDVNRRIHPIDMAKDLKVKGFLRPSLHGPAMRYVIQTLFRRQNGQLALDLNNIPDFISIGDRKDTIQEIVNQAGLNQNLKTMNIIRQKHLSGHDLRPINFYLAQDNGPTDIIVDPTLFLTPGSVLDPAGKTKRGAIRRMDAPYNILTADDIANLGLETMINGGITFSQVENNLGEERFQFDMNIFEFNQAAAIVSVPFSCQFTTNTFQPVGNGVNNNHLFFMGNNTKNERCAHLLSTASNRGTAANPPREANRYHLTWAEINEIRKWVIMKELGDTLQVQWVNRVFSVGPIGDDDDDIQRSNTVVGTTDSVVEQRCIINIVGVMKTENEGANTIYSLPRSQDPGQVIRKYIRKIKEELIAQNFSVIEELRNVRESAASSINPLTFQTSPWVNTQVWTNQQKARAYNFLTTIISTCENTNININKSFDELITQTEGAAAAAVDQAARAAVWSNAADQARVDSTDNRFKTPFVFRQGQVPKTVRLPQHRLHPTIIFRSDRFSPNFFNNDQQILALQQIGGQVFPDFTTLGLDDATRNDFINAYIDQRNVFLFFRSVLDNPRGILPMAGYRPKSGFIWQAMGNNDKMRDGFIFCFVREFHPEIFTLAHLFEKVFHWFKGWYDPLNLIREDFHILNTYYRNNNIFWDDDNEEDDTDVTYYFNKRQTFISVYRQAGAPYTDEEIFEMNEYTILCIRIAKRILSLFPSLLTRELKYFTETLAPDAEYPPIQDPWLLSDFLANYEAMNPAGGSKVTTETKTKKKETDLFTSIYADLHQEYQMLDIKYSYKYGINTHALCLEGNEKIRDEYVKDLFILADTIDSTPSDDKLTSVIFKIESNCIRNHAKRLSEATSIPSPEPIRAPNTRPSANKKNNRSLRPNSKTVTRQGNISSTRKTNTKRNNTKKRNNSTRRNNRSKASNMKN
jgi:hypothetical protein